MDEGNSPSRNRSGIIREEVEKADQILTELMGYAQLAEGRVERLDLAQELDEAILQVFPTGAKYNVPSERDYAEDLPACAHAKAASFQHSDESAAKRAGGAQRRRVKSR